jgi:hypothetical protein
MHILCSITWNMFTLYFNEPIFNTKR